MKDLYPRDYRRYEGSRFAVELSEFAQWLRKLGYTRHCLRGHLFRLKKILEGSERFQPQALSATRICEKCSRSSRHAQPSTGERSEPLNASCLLLDD